MAWTDGVDYSTGQLISATIWNNYLGAAGNIDLTAPGVVTTGGDTVYATGDNTLARLAKGTARQNLTMNSGATAPEWTNSPASLMTGGGDILQASGANTPARLAIGSGGMVLSSTGSAAQWGLTLTNSITAGSTQSQAGATALTTMMNRVTVVGTNGDGVKLPTAIAGLEIEIINDDSAQTIKVWPNTDDAIDGGSANAVDANQIDAGSSRRYIAIDATNWYTASPGGGGISGWAANGANNDLLPDSASAGIYLGVNSATAANLLDDYEEGTWTPLMKDTSGNAMTSDTVEGHYTKVGREVYIHVYVQTSSLGSASGGIRLYTLPFAASSAYNYGGCVCHYGDGLAITAGEAINCRTNGNVSYLRLQVWDASGGTTDMQASEWTADGQAMFTGSYIAG